LTASIVKQQLVNYAQIEHIRLSSQSMCAAVTEPTVFVSVLQEAELSREFFAKHLQNRQVLSA